MPSSALLASSSAASSLYPVTFVWVKSGLLGRGVLKWDGTPHLVPFILVLLLKQLKQKMNIYLYKEGYFFLYIFKRKMKLWWKIWTIALRIFLSFSQEEVGGKNKQKYKNLLGNIDTLFLLCCLQIWFISFAGILQNSTVNLINVRNISAFNLIPAKLNISK